MKPKSMKVKYESIDTEEIGSRIYADLLKEGYYPSNHEIEVISNSLFDLLIDKKIIDKDTVEFIK